jgi:hypothetical protein
MNWSASSIENLRRVFAEGFTARDISEPLVSFDSSPSATEVLSLMQAEDFDVVGVRRNGITVGYVDRTDIDVGVCGQSIRAFDDAVVISDVAPLADVVFGLHRSPRLFVRILGTVSGIISNDDLQKPPVRMWLFGMITLIETRMSNLVERFCEGESWRQFLSDNRLQKAETLLEEHLRRNQSLRLVDCLQFSDKGQIIARNEAIRSLTRFTSRRQVEQTCRAMESLRNNLAHSQDILSSDWDTIVTFSADIDGIISGTTQFRDAIDANCSQNSTRKVRSDRGD